jgi:hypothetical protein
VLHSVDADVGVVLPVGDNIDKVEVLAVAKLLPGILRA